jgi:spore coat polysaccharide biosynthesis predicted glycosyltransferase SpsG
MSHADLAFSSAGRTLYELASVGVPAIVMAQNQLEMKHTFAALDNGFLSLGLCSEVTDEALGAAYSSVMGSVHLRRALYERTNKLDLSGGRHRVIQRILEV